MSAKDIVSSWPEWKQKIRLTKYSPEIDAVNRSQPMNSEQLLKEYNCWRRGDPGYEMPNPTEIGIAIDSVLAQLAALKEEDERLKEIEHRVWHLLDEAIDDGSGELKISIHNNVDLDELNKLLPDDCHEAAGERLSIRAERDHLKARVAELESALKLALEYWQHRQQRYKNRFPSWVVAAKEALKEPDLAEYVCRAVNLAVDLNKQPRGEV